MSTIPSINFVENITTIVERVNNPIPPITRFMHKYGDIYWIKLGLAKAIIISSPAYAQHVLQTNNKNYHKSFMQTEVLGRYLGYGLLTINGDYWLKQRRLIQPGFHRHRLAGLANIMVQQINSVIDELPLNTPTDIVPFTMRLAFKVVTQSLFNSGLSHKELDYLSDILIEVQKHLIKRARQPYLIPWLNISGREKAIRAKIEEADTIIYRNIEERKKSGQKMDDLADMLLEARYEDTGEGMTAKQLRDEVLVLIVAGHETSANALAWILYLLSMHPRVEQKLLQELNEQLKQRDVSLSDLPNLPYTNKVIQEAMRLYPPAWITDRVALEDDTIGGHHIPKGTPVFVYINGIHNNAKYWEKPEQFMPERFEKAQMKEKHRFAYFPFGGGPRLCIGKNFALMELQIALAQLMRKYHFKTINPQKVDIEPLVTLRPRNGINMLITKR